MKYLLLLFVVLILAANIYKNFIADDLPVAFTQLVEAQQNTFTVSEDSAAIMWQRARYFLKERKAWIGGGNIIRKDSLLYIPYSNSYEKGSCVKIKMTAIADSVMFQSFWWYSREIEEFGSKEIALYMQTGQGRYDKKFRDK